MKKANKNIIILLLLSVLILVSTRLLIGQNKYYIPGNLVLLQLSEVMAMEEVGTKEATGKNDGEVEKYLKSVGLGPGYPYCMAGQYWAFDTAAAILDSHCYPVKIPIPKTAGANVPYNNAKKNGYKTNYRAEKHDLIIWKKYNSWTGHVERVIKELDAGYVQTVGFNTSTRGKRSIYPDPSYLPPNRAVTYSRTCWI